MSGTDSSSETSIDDCLEQSHAAAEAGDYGQAVQLLDAALAACPPQRFDLRARLLALQGQHLPRLGRLQAAVRSASEAVVLAEPLADPAMLADALTALTFVYAQLLMGREALTSGLRALSAAERSGDAQRQGWALNRIGYAYASLDNSALACELTQQALDIATREGLEELRFACLNNLAYLWLLRLPESQRRGDAAALQQIGQQAHDLAQQAWAIARRRQSPFLISISLSNLCDALLAQGNFKAAAPLLDEYLALSQTHGYSDLVLQAQTQRAQIQREQGQTDEALRGLDALLEATAGNIAPKRRHTVMRLLYETHKAAQRFREALHWLEQLIEQERQISHDTLVLQAEALKIRQEVEQAREQTRLAEQQVAHERRRVGELEIERLRLREELATWDRAAHEDMLTGLHNRRHAEPALAMLLEGARLKARPVALAMVDVDHFKRINDRHGHATGDQVLQELGGLLRRSMRDADLLARVGGEEFLIALLDIEDAQALEICNRLRDQVAAHDWRRLHPALAVSISIGLTVGIPPAEPAAMQARADRALYVAKRAGRNRVALG